MGEKGKQEVVDMVEEEVVVMEEEEEEKAIMEEGAVMEEWAVTVGRRFWRRRWLHPRVTRVHLTGLWTVARCKCGLCLFVCQSHHLSLHTLFLDHALPSSPHPLPPHLSPHRHKEGGTSR